MTQRSPLQTEQELLMLARALSGASIAQVAHELGRPVPPDLRRHKGWVGELVEAVLGATGSSLPQPDFPHLGVELKTLPVDRKGRPCESTYVCTVPLEEVGQTWESSWVRRKLMRVLWVPYEGDADLKLHDRRFGTALLWSPAPEQEACLRRDWEDLMDLVCMGDIDRVTARFGDVLQIRPKAAHGRARRGAVGDQGGRVLINPRGFYLRASFTATILRQNYY